MPVYEYACKACGEHVEVAQSFRDDPLTTCESCGGPLRKVFGSIGVVLKGSGFYRTDSRRESRAARSEAKSESKAPATDAKTDSKSDTKSDSKSDSKSDTSSASGSKADSGSKPKTTESAKSA